VNRFDWSATRPTEPARRGWIKYSLAIFKRRRATGQQVVQSTNVLCT
jgi:hypothetical protein